MEVCYILIMTQAGQLEKVLYAYRGTLQFFGKERSIFYHTEPFLVGVGCGGGSSSELFVNTARKAVNGGYKIRLQSTQDHQRQQYPLHPDDAAHIKREFKAEDFV